MLTLGPVFHFFIVHEYIGEDQEAKGIMDIGYTEDNVI